MNDKIIQILENRNLHSTIDLLIELEKDGWRLLNPDLEEKEGMAQEWEEEDIIHHKPEDHCLWCNEHRSAWETIHGRSSAE